MSLNMQERDLTPLVHAEQFKLLYIYILWCVHVNCEFEPHVFNIVQIQTLCWSSSTTDFVFETFVVVEAIIVHKSSQVCFIVIATIYS